MKAPIKQKIYLFLTMLFELEQYTAIFATINTTSTTTTTTTFTSKHTKLCWNCLITITNILQSTRNKAVSPILNEYILQSISIIQGATETLEKTPFTKEDYQKLLINIMTAGLSSQHFTTQTSLALLNGIVEKPYKDLFAFFLHPLETRKDKNINTNNKEKLKSLFAQIKGDQKMTKLFWSLWKRIPSDEEVLLTMILMDSPIFYRRPSGILKDKLLLKDTLNFLFINANINEMIRLATDNNSLDLLPTAQQQERQQQHKVDLKEQFMEIYNNLFSTTLPLIKASSKKSLSLYSALISDFLHLIHLSILVTDNRLRDRLKRRFIQYLGAMSLTKWITLLEKENNNNTEYPLLLNFTSLGLPLHLKNQSFLSGSTFRKSICTRNTSLTREELEKLCVSDFVDPFFAGPSLDFGNDSITTKKNRNTLILAFVNGSLLISWGTEVRRLEGFSDIFERFKEIVVAIKESIFKKSTTVAATATAPTKKDWWNRRIWLEDQLSSLIGDCFFSDFANVLSLLGFFSGSGSSGSSAGYILLQVDRYTHQFPWELVIPSKVMRTFFGAGVLEAPSKNGLQVKKSPTKVGVLLNPSGDLALTQKIITESLSVSRNFTINPMIAGRGLADVGEKNLLLDGDYYMYFGHGSGASYLRKPDPPSPSLVDRSGSFMFGGCSGFDVMNTNCGGDGDCLSSNRKSVKLPVTFLFGCSSGKITSYDDESITEGTLLFFIRNGSPMVISNLWDITDRDHDRMCQQFLSDGRFDPLTVLDNLNKAKKKCLFPLINGAATVVYC